MSGELLDQAAAYAKRGWRILPVHSITPGGTCSCGEREPCKQGKHPRISGWPALASNAGADVWEWWQNWPVANVGIATGRASGIWALDIDPDNGGDATLGELLAEHGPLPATRTHSTGSGGTHYLWSYPPDFEVPRTAGKVFGKGIDTLGEDSFMVAPPSVSGKGAYTVTDHRDPVPAPGWLLQPLREYAAQKATQAEAAPLAGEPVDQAAVTGKLLELLGEFKPGERSEHFWYIVAEARRSGYTQGQIVTLVAPWCKASGKYIGRVETQVAACWGKLEAEAAALRFPVPGGQVNEPGASPEPWERPAPLGIRGALPGFPVDAFPDWIRDEVEAVAEFTQTPPDLGGTVVLGVLAAACGGRAVVEVRGSWREPLNLFAVAAMPPGSRKSAVFDTLTSPLLDTEKTLVETIEPQIIEAATMRKVAQKEADKAATAASGAKGEGREQAIANAIEAAQIAEAITVPVMPRLVADDITPEAAASLLAEQGGRLAVLSAEGGIFAVLAGRYSGGVPSLEVFLKGHSGDQLRVDRKGRPPEHVPRPALTLALCVQPDVLRAIADMPGFRGRGLLARILYSLPPDLVGHRKIGTPAVPDAVRDTYAANISTLVLTLADWTDPAVLTLTPEASDMILAAEEAIEPRLDADAGDLAAIRDWASKQIGATVRIAGLLHLAQHLTDGWGKPISGDTMRNAIRIADYYTAHALAAFDHMGVDPVIEDARVLYRWIERTRPARFTKRELFTALSRSRFPKVGDLDGPLDLLELHGYIRRQAEPERTGPGRRPSPGYSVHPDVAAETAETAETA